MGRLPRHQQARRGPSRQPVADHVEQEQMGEPCGYRADGRPYLTAVRPPSERNLPESRLSTVGKASAALRVEEGACGAAVAKEPGERHLAPHHWRLRASNSVARVFDFCSIKRRRRFGTWALRNPVNTRVIYRRGHFRPSGGRAEGFVILSPRRTEWRMGNLSTGRGPNRQLLSNPKLSATRGDLGKIK